MRTTIYSPEHPNANTNGYVRRYVLAVERALGRYLRHGELVHHANLDEHDDRNCNLVVCPDQAYHMLLHRRTRAYRACGNANARPCRLCKHWDVPGDNGMRVYPEGNSSRAQHSACNAMMLRTRRAAA